MSLDINFNTSVLPADNFYSYVNNDWMQKNPIPSDFNRWGSFSQLSEENREKIKMILEDTTDTTSKFSRLNILYKQGLDDEKRKDVSEIYNYFNEINSCKSIDQLLELVVDYKLSWNLPSPTALIVYGDANDSNFSILHLYASGIGLPDRDYYLLDTKEKEREEYKKYLLKLNEYFKLSLDINGIYNLEKNMAEYMYTKVEQRNPELSNNPRTLNQILDEYPSFKFLNYFFNKLNITYANQNINLSNPKFFANLNKLFHEISLDLWKDYFVYKFIYSSYMFLSVELEQIVFDFYDHVLSGTPKMKPVWKRSSDTVESQFGELIGQKYSEKYFSENAKKEALEMVHYLKAELRNSIVKLDWMDLKTKNKALQKLDLMNIKIGYPDKWREYKSDIQYTNSYFKNNLLCNKDDNEFTFSRLYKPVDKTEWGMYPQMVNAYYSPSFNEIVFPAGILQPPFFSEHYEKAINFGGIGVVIGHEMTHGFDDEGCKFDGFGNLNIWWSDNDKIKYKAKTDVLEKQFDEYTINGNKVNGKLTLGENIADLGGVFIALEGLKNFLNQNQELNLNQNDNLTPIQKFFINYARVWRCNIRDEEMKKRLIIDPHSPPELRVNGILNNVDDFYTAFNVNENNKLYLEKSKRAKIW